MRTVYIKLDEQNKIVRCDTNNIDGYIEVEVEDDMNGDKLFSSFYINGQIKFDSANYAMRVAKRKEQMDAAKQKKKLKDIEMRHRLAALSDEEALSVMSLFPSWNKDVSYRNGERLVYDNKLYKLMNDTDGDSLPPDKNDSLYSVIM